MRQKYLTSWDRKNRFDSTDLQYQNWYKRCSRTWTYTCMHTPEQNPTMNQCASMTGAHNLGGYCAMLESQHEILPRWTRRWFEMIKQAKHVAARNCASWENNRGHELSAWREKTKRCETQPNSRVHQNSITVSRHGIHYVKVHSYCGMFWISTCAFFDVASHGYEWNDRWIDAVLVCNFDSMMI